MGKDARYSLKQVAYTTDKQRRVRKDRFITIQSGLTWQEAKAAQRQHKGSSIVPERAEPTPIAVASPAEVAPEG